MSEDLADPQSAPVKALWDEIDRLTTLLWKANVCPHGMVREGQPVGTCLAGFPGCVCMDAVMRRKPEPHLPNAHIEVVSELEGGLWLLEYAKHGDAPCQYLVKGDDEDDAVATFLRERLPDEGV
jgi:hypothetical protein